MTKTFLKIGFILFCMGLIIFLLLPFLETTPPATSSLHAGQAQVVSDNPLTAIAKRLASLFGRKERARQNLAKGNQPPQPPTVLYASVPDASTFADNTAGQTANKFGETAPSHTVNVPADQVRNYEDAAFQTDSGEWVLVRQTAPQSSAPGMHEINVHDNPYDRYVRQERARHFTPQTAKQEIPLSRWARITRPIKSFFGFDEPTPVPASSVRVHQEGDKLASLGSGQDKLSGARADTSSQYPYMRIPLPDITPQQWAKLSVPQRERLQERQAAREFADLLSGGDAAGQAARLVADALYPNPQNNAERKQKEGLIQRLTAENKQRIQDSVMAKILENATDKEPVDELAYMTGCNASLPSTHGACKLPGTPPQHEPQGILKQAQEENAQSFFEQTKFVLPKGLPFIPIVGPTDPANFQNMADPAAGEIYTSMYDQQKCNSRPCYWVPNSNPSDFKMTDTFTTVGDAKLKADMYNTYDNFWEGFKQAKVEALGPDATDEEKKQAEEEAAKQWKEHRPNWVPWIEDNLVQLNQDNKEALGAPLDKPSAKEVAFPVATDPAIAPDIANTIGPTNFVSNQVSLVNSDNSVTQAGKLLTDSFSKTVNDVKEASRQVIGDGLQKNIGPTLNRIFSQVNSKGGGIKEHADALKKWEQTQKGSSKK